MTKKKQKRRKVGILFAVLKYGFSVMATVMTCTAVHNWALLPVGLAELFLIWTVSNALLNLVNPLGQIIHFLLLFLYSGQMLVMYFGNSFTTLLMLTNLVSLEDLSGNFGVYLMLLIPMLVILFYPMVTVRLRRKRGGLMLGAALLIWLGTVLGFSASCSPLISAGLVVRDAVDQRNMRAEIQNNDAVDRSQFYRAGIADNRAKPGDLPEQPNVILIFAEGLSQSIVEDERAIMPFLASLEEKSLFFENYYNHTFATYRGLIGQLYSGFQLSDFDSNSLVSMQSMFGDLGYTTTFINTEPDNVQFTAYLGRMDFDELLSKDEWMTSNYGLLYVSDREAFNRLYETALELHDGDKPFFLSMYSFGTHASLNSPDLLNGDGTTPEINKFYNLDAQLQAFFERYEQGELARDTLIVITGDHCTYQDKAFTEAFPDYPRYCTEIDRVPLILYYPGIQSERVDAQGRNTLDLAPTVLDYIDVSAPNYFLGDSLFGLGQEVREDVLPFDRIFFDGSYIYRTDLGEEIELQDAMRQDALERIMEYFAVSINTSTDDDSYDFDVTPSSDSRYLSIISTHQVEMGQRLWFGVWSGQNEQDDIKWYRPVYTFEGVAHCVVPLINHGDSGTYLIHEYIGDDQRPTPGSYIAGKNCYVSKTPTPYEIDIALNEAQAKMEIAVPMNLLEGEVLYFAVWGSEDGQNDLAWYTASDDGSGSQRVTVDLNEHAEKGQYIIDMYLGTDVNYGTMLGRGECMVE